MLTAPRKHQSGVTLIEMMIAMVVGFIILGGALYLGNRSMQASRDNIRMSFLNQELRDTLYRVTTDLKRASYWGGSLYLGRVNTVTELAFSGNTSGSSVNITQVFDTAEVSDAVVDALGNSARTGSTLVYLHQDVEDSDSDGNKTEVFVYKATITAYNAGTNTYTATLQTNFPSKVLTSVPKNSWTIIGPAPAITISGNCATFSYDQNGDGLITDGSGSAADERIGYRFDNTDGAVEMRSGGAGCGDGGWVNITDDKAVQVTAFTITDNSPAGVTASALSVTVREYTIEISGLLRSEPTITRRVRETVRVRNNQIS